MADRIIQSETLQSIANALRGGSSQGAEDKIAVEDFAEKAGETLEQFAGVVDRTATSVKIPNTVQKVGKFAFYNSDIVSVDLNEATELGNNAFEKSKLTSIDLSKVTKLGAYCLSGTKLVNVVIPNTVLEQNAGDHSFYQCDALKTYSLPENWTKIPNYMFGETAIENLVIPSNIEVIGQSAFYHCMGLINITIPGTVKTISSNAFSRCENVETITVENGCTTLEGNAFNYIPKCELINLPSTITSIGTWAFSSMKSTGVINCGFAEGAVAGAPWGAPEGVTINYGVTSKAKGTKGTKAASTVVVTKEMAEEYTRNNPIEEEGEEK